jgi:hypothetical protein
MACRADKGQEPWAAARQSHLLADLAKIISKLIYANIDYELDYGKT